MALAADLTVETAAYVCVASCTLGDRASWDRDYAAVGGNMVRLYKLLNGFLDQLDKRRGDLYFIFARPIFETIVNIRFLIEFFSSELIDSYVEVSLRHERKLRDRIEGNVKDRSGIVLPNRRSYVEVY